MFAGDGNVRRSAARIPGRYIVVLAAETQVSEMAEAVKNRGQARIHHQYEKGIKGLALEMTEAEAQKMAKDPRVDFVEEDAEISASQVPWGLDRMDQRYLPLNGSFSPGRTGRGVRVYVIDSGISPHLDFGWRLASGYSAIVDDQGTRDCNGHGTHVAGIIGGYTYGVADGVTLVPVRVLDCKGKGSISVLLDGLQWVMIDRYFYGRPSVANMSFTGNASTALDNAITSMLNLGITTVAAAGNGGDDACRYSPARVSRVITVGATTSIDERTSWSNYGMCVDLFAPGTDIVSTSNASPYGTQTMSGTSQAAPFVTGNAALWLERDPYASPDTIATYMLTQATGNIVRNAGDGSPNRLACTHVFDFNYRPRVAQLVSDSGFENGTAFWSTEICTVINQTGCPPEAMMEIMSVSNLPSRSGTTHASMGGRPKDIQILSAPMSVPADADTVELSFYLWVITAEHKGAADDLLTVEVRDAAGNLLETLGTLSNLDESSSYVQKNFDMSKYRGQTIRLAFKSNADNGAPTWFLLDDVELNAWH